MVKLAKYLKPYVLLLFLAVFFIFVQAMSDLSLPDYMSKMVNVGIQQGGIINAVPEAIRKSEMDKLLLFVTPEEKGEILNDYTLVDKSSVDYNKYIKNIPFFQKNLYMCLKI